MKQVDIAVIGGGHAGCEAAAAAARMGARVALVSLSKEGIGVLSCNPAVGGLGKGHLVREIDALDGLMGRVADRAGIQFRLLNRSKGPAVQGPRAQVDRVLYRRAMQEALHALEGLEIIEGEVVDLRVADGRCAGLVLADGGEIAARAVILTTGTFLNGILHIGHERTDGGRMGDRAARRLSDRLKDLGLRRGRLKTGTPPRLDGRSVDWSGLELQPGDEVPTMFSFLSEGPFVRQVSCGITHTNERTHDIVRRNLSESAIYGGCIEGVGPRYCPSIEDKVLRFADKESHQIFLEPEGLEDPTVYPNGISTSLPAPVQEQYVRTIRGLEQAVITQFGYAVEYDFFDPRQLTSALELRDLPGLFLAGQVNGTTGYEEAAAQGLVAGLNAASGIRDGGAVRFARTDSYIGVLVDDLTTRGVTEPYRMFTSRAEFRLSLRADNADERLTPTGIALGCVSQERRRAFERKMEDITQARAVLKGRRVKPSELHALGLALGGSGQTRSAYELLGFPGVTIKGLVEAGLMPEKPGTDAVCAQVEREALYAQYLPRQLADIAAIRRDEARPIPDDLDFSLLPGLTREVAGRLAQQRPATLGEAARIEGVTPAALAVLMSVLRRRAAGRVA